MVFEKSQFCKRDVMHISGHHIHEFEISGDLLMSADRYPFDHNGTKVRGLHTVT